MLSPASVRWLLVGALLVSLVVDFLDGDPFKLLGTGLLTVAALLFASGRADGHPGARRAMLGLVLAAAAVLAYRLLVRRA